MSGLQGGLIPASDRPPAFAPDGRCGHQLLGATRGLPQALQNQSATSATTSTVITKPGATGAPRAAKALCSSSTASPSAWRREAGFPPASCWARPGTKPAGAKQSRPPTAPQLFNLFGIKAGKGWTGKGGPRSRPPRYINGTPRKVVAKFRAYDSYEDSFRDYAKLITDNPRYEKAQATAKTRFCRGLCGRAAKAGYATDPGVRQEAQRRHQQRAARTARPGVMVEEPR